MAAFDPHGDRAVAQGNLESRLGAPGGIATLDSKGKVTRSQLSLCPVGGYVPEGWGQYWRAKRDAAPFAGNKARVAFVGDSVTFGYYVSDLANTSWAGRVRTALQAKYGDGGSGMFTASRSATIITGKPEATTAWAANNSIMTQTGTWSRGATFHGPGISHIYANSAASASLRVRGTSLKIYTLAGTATNAAYTYKVDAGPVVTVPASAATSPTVESLEVTGLAEGDHTVTVAWNGTASTQRFCLIGVGAENSTGIVVDNLGRSGARTDHFTDTTASNVVWNGGTSYPADLVIYSLGLNDADQGVTPDAWTTNVTKHLQAIKAVNLGKTDILIVLQHQGNFAQTTQYYSEYSRRAHGMAETYGAALVNLWPLGRNSYAFQAAGGYWGNSANPGTSGTDVVHLSDAGAQFIADTITPLLAD